ncbi:MAG: phosphoribosylformylglycinamidine cyclo-ligase [Acidimicrobiia bacterium]|nr:phosphoribosylformylglycinamidine cyclo-ligase [Acidimicrobiia bacterium]
MADGPTYADAGVDLEGAERHVASIAPLVTATWGPNVVGGFGGFAAGVELPEGYRRPILMMSTDGVGTKLELARATGRWEGVGYDLVAMCVDDLAVVGARPISFVDYLAVGKLHPERDATIVGSIARACADAGAALVGGETAEHPGVMDVDAVDLAGAAVGVCERGTEITGDHIEAGHSIVGIASPNLRSNGFSLVRRVFAGADLESDTLDGVPLAEVLTEPSVLYSPLALAIAEAGLASGMAHITGGGIPGNLVRPLPIGCTASVRRRAWTWPPIFEELARRGGLSREAMEETFNLGVGFCVVTPAPTDVVGTAEAMGYQAFEIGEIEEGERRVVMR